SRRRASPTNPDLALEDQLVPLHRCERKAATVLEQLLPRCEGTLGDHASPGNLGDVSRVELRTEAEWHFRHNDSGELRWGDDGGELRWGDATCGLKCVHRVRREDDAR